MFDINDAKLVKTFIDRYILFNMKLLYYGKTKK